MTFEVVPFHVEHIKPLLEEELNKGFVPLWTREDYYYPKYIAANSEAFTGLVKGEPMVCAFIVELWQGRGYLVVILSEKIKEHSVAVYRGIKNKFLKMQSYDRLEMDVPVDMDIAHRRAKMLGFELVQKQARKYLPDGSDASIYAWVRE